MAKGGKHCEKCGLIFPNTNKGHGVSSPGLRNTLAERDGAICFYCGHDLVIIYDQFAHGMWHATIDHKIPKSRGGTRDLNNLVLSCSHCNQAKSDLTLEQWRDLGFPRRRAIASGTYVPVEHM